MAMEILMIEEKSPSQSLIIEKLQMPMEEELDEFYYEGDSDNDPDEEFNDFMRHDVIEETACRTHDIICDENEHGRRCIDVPVCHKDQHDRPFDGSPLFELFKVRARFNPHFSPAPLTGKLYGEIVTCERDFDEADEIRLDADNLFVALPIRDPQPRHAFCDDYGLFLDFAFRIDDEDVFHYGQDHSNPRLFGDRGCVSFGMCVAPVAGRNSRHSGPVIGFMVMGAHRHDPILVGAHYSLFMGAWATINVELLAGGVTSLGRGGLIVARPCIFRSRIRLLTIDREPQAVESSGLVKLRRSVVAVPSYASLVFGAKLYDEHGHLFCLGKIAFPAKEAGEDSRIISYRGVEALRVSVRWQCQ